MLPIDYRNATFADLQARIEGDRARVLTAWMQHGPCTTDELAQLSGLSILSLRPRTTELFHLGFVLCIGGGSRGAGVYRAATEAEVQAEFSRRRAQAQPAGQAELALGDTQPRRRFY